MGRSQIAHGNFGRWLGCIEENAILFLGKIKTLFGTIEIESPTRRRENARTSRAAGQLASKAPGDLLRARAPSYFLDGGCMERRCAVEGGSVQNYRANLARIGDVDRRVGGKNQPVRPMNVAAKPLEIEARFDDERLDAGPPRKTLLPGNG